MLARNDNQMFDTPWLLDQWARWARSNPDNIGYPTIEPFRRLLGSKGLSPAISDDEAMRVDAALSRLLARDSEMGEAVTKYYLYGGNLSRLARELKVDRRRAEVIVKAGTAWMDCALYAL
ncbi:antiterminator Q family protein [Marinibactrum halimedae]|uniref:Antitermination protein Q n=1 Tax=Marinibactrum halimedae TaxID=1444977 RepID=A0AA37WN43_9GAMM|nr:antiterminator Q family protein [Marinibactrum halimedae]MCD9458906.1 hypothetical protein [Marinibactrum halimedae]GLS27754.1 hypothetical protein GCM10007877_34730 [Marinibactrum halimedae]